MKQEFHFPTIIGIVLLVVSSLVGVILLRSSNDNRSSAGNDCLPINAQITNITDHSADISFTTDIACNSLININNTTLSDARSTGLNQNYQSITHYFQVNNLSPDSQYSFTAIGGGKAFDQSYFKFKTGKKPTTSIPTSNLAWGKVLNSDLKPASTAIIYLNIPGASPLSSFVTTNGNWNISLANSFNESQNNWFTPVANVIEDITVISKDYPPLVLTGNTSNNNPVPDIILGKTTSLEATTTIPTQSVNAFPTASSNTSVKPLTITSPKEDEYIGSVSPLFFGQASAGGQINLQLTSSGTTLDKTVLSDQSGNWQWPLTSNLPSGQKTLKATSGTQSITRVFYVSATISGPAFVASPSAIISQSPSLIPTSVILPTDIPTQIPTTPARVAKPATTSGVPTTGTGLPTLVITTTGILITIFGLLLFR